MEENELKEPAFKYNYISSAEYLAAERAAEEKHEYFDGLVLSMSGASLRHTRILGNISRHTGNYLEEGNCEILQNDMRVSTPLQDAYMYPDAVIFCGEPQLEDDKFDTLLNPVVIIEILSPSTRSIDKGRKLIFYQRIPSLQEYIMIDSQKKFIQLARKQINSGWIFEEINNPEGSLYIRSIDFHLAFEKIYKDTGL